MEIVFLFVGLLLGAFVTYFFIKNKPSVIEKEFQLKFKGKRADHIIELKSGYKARNGQ